MSRITRELALIKQKDNPQTSQEDKELWQDKSHN